MCYNLLFSSVLNCESLGGLKATSIAVAPKGWMTWLTISVDDILTIRLHLSVIVRSLILTTASSILFKPTHALSIRIQYT